MERGNQELDQSPGGPCLSACCPVDLGVPPDLSSVLRLAWNLAGGGGTHFESGFSNGKVGPTAAALRDNVNLWKYS